MLSKLGKADSASVVSVGSVQQGRYVDDWGPAQAHFPNGMSILHNYLIALAEAGGRNLEGVSQPVDSKQLISRAIPLHLSTNCFSTSA